MKKLAEVAIAVGVLWASSAEPAQERPAAETVVLQAGCNEVPAVFVPCALEKIRTFNPPRTPEGVPDLQGYWVARSQGAASDLEENPPRWDWMGGKSIVVDPADGRIPYQPWSLKERAWRHRLENHIYDPEPHCFLSGVPRQMWIMPYQIVQTPGYVLTLHEYIHATRIIAVSDRPRLTDRLRLWQGDSAGRWEGNTLAVTTTNGNGMTWLEHAGNFASDALRVDERFTLVDANTILYQATLTDPKVFTRPWTLAFPIVRQAQKDFEILESACHEDERDLQHLRALQKR